MNNGIGRLSGILISALIAILTAAAALLALAGVAFVSEDPDEMLELFAYAALLSGALACALSCILRHNSAAEGAAAGFIYSCVLWCVSIIFGECGSIIRALIITAFSIATPAAAGALRARRNVRPRSHAGARRAMMKKIGVKK